MPAIRRLTLSFALLLALFSESRAQTVESARNYLVIHLAGIENISASEQGLATYNLSVAFETLDEEKWAWKSNSLNSYGHPEILMTLEQAVYEFSFLVSEVTLPATSTIFKGRPAVRILCRIPECITMIGTRTTMRGNAGGSTQEDEPVVVNKAINSVVFPVKTEDDLQGAIAATNFLLESGGAKEADF